MLAQEGMATEEELGKLMETVVVDGNCDGAIQSFLQDMGMPAA